LLTRQGILSLLDEECAFPKATPETLCLKLYSALGRSPYLPRSEARKANEFQVKHFVQPVVYSANGFLEKNKDYLIKEQVALFAAGNAFVAELFATPDRPAALDKLSIFYSRTPPSSPVKAEPTRSPGKIDPREKRWSAPPPLQRRNSFQLLTVASQFKQSLLALLSTVLFFSEPQIGQTEPMFVRCVKPNPLKAAQSFVPTSVLHQLRCGGVFECVRVSQAGYPTRQPFSQFLARLILSHVQVWVNDSISGGSVPAGADRRLSCQSCLSRQRFCHWENQSVPTSRRARLAGAKTH
jgi:myosin-5